MAEVLKKKEIHVFNRFGQNLAFDVNDMHLFEINHLTKEIFQNVDGKTPEELTAMLSDHFPPTEVLHVLSQLIDLNLIGYQPPNTVVGTENPKQEEYPEDGIKRLVLLVSHACNLKCRYCYTHANDHIEKKYMSEEVAIAAVDLLFLESKNIKDLRIGFYGGEPMLQFDLIKRIIPYAESKAEKLQKTIIFTMTTNGTLLTDETIKFIVENNIHAAVSLDGNREIHNKNRVFPDGSGSFEKVFPAYTHLKEKASETSALTVMSSFDVPMKDIAQGLLDLGIPDVKIVPAISTAGQFEIPVSGDNRCDCVDTYIGQYEELVQYFLDKEIIFQEPPPLDFARIFELLDKKEKRATNCGGSNTRFAVDAEGNILPCENFIAEPEFYMGNVLTGLDTSYRKIFKNIRAANSEICRACWARYVCGGWCPFFSFNRYGDLKKPVDDQCRFKKSYFEIGMGVYSLFKKRKK